MTEPEHTQILYRGACGCGWKADWQAADADAKADQREHCRETGCIVSDRIVLERGNWDDLMPHERRKAAR